MNELWTIKEIAEKAESEGLCYIVQDYLDANSIEDEELKALWKEANAVLEKIDAKLKPFMYLEEN